MVKNLPASAGDAGSIPESGRSPGEGDGYPTRFLAWEIPQTEEPGELQSMGHQRVEHGLASKQQFLKKLNTESPHDPAIPLVGMS